MTDALAMAAIAIDISQWYTVRHQAQVTADSAALAAANCLAFPGNGPASAVQLVRDRPGRRENYCSEIQPERRHCQHENVAINTTSYTVTVTATVTVGTGFASFFGMGARNISATRSRRLRPSQRPVPARTVISCLPTTPTARTQEPGLPSTQTVASRTINGNIQTNGNLNVSTNGNVTSRTPIRPGFIVYS